ncbi:MAG: glutamate--cysteine ligase, partial [Propionibacteriaceae bacterium]|nr:glutamate--cysteine ligase [Propionibacteriaceae bacterium]
MNIAFTHSPQSTLGVEWELHLVDQATLELAPVAAELVALVGPDEGQPIRKEYLPCCIEVVSQPRRRVADAIADIAAHLDRLRPAAAELGVTLMGAGSHPFGDPAGTKPYPIPRYLEVAERNQWWGRQMTICGTHVHVGVSDRAKVLPMMWTYARFYPHILALTAASPFWYGEDTGYASQRTMMFQQLCTNGLPYYFSEWAEFEACVDDLVRCGIIEHVDELRWDVRPSPKFGTVENRIPDSAPTLAEIGCQAALTQCLGQYFSDSLDDGDSPDYLPPWLVRENKWRAARYGLEAEIITPQPGRLLLPLREAIERLVEHLMPYAETLDCVAELSFASELLRHGASYERQRHVAAQAGWAPDAPAAANRGAL